MPAEKHSYAVPRESRSTIGKEMDRDFLEAVIPSDDNIHTGPAAEELIDGFGIQAVETVEQYAYLTGGEQRDAAVQIHKGPKLHPGRYKLVPLEIERVVDADGVDRRYLLTKSIVSGISQIGDLIDDTDINTGTAADFAGVTNQGGQTVSGWSTLFDYRRDTYIKGAAGAQFTVRFRGTRLISRIVPETRIASRITIDVIDIRGNLHRVLDGTANHETPTSDIAGCDTGNFGPLEAKSIRFTCHEAFQIYRLNIRRALEMKVANPVRKQDDIIFDDLDHANCTMVGFANNDNNALRYLFDENPGVGLVGTGGATPTATIYLTKPQLLARIAIVAQNGQSIRNTRVRLYDVNGVLLDTPINDWADAAAKNGVESGNIVPRLVRHIILDFNSAADVYPAVLMLKKMDETKISTGGAAIPTKSSWMMASLDGQALVAGDNDIDLNMVDSGGNNVQYAELVTTHIRLDDQTVRIVSLTVYRDAARTDTIKEFTPDAAGDFHLDSASIIESATDGTLYATINVNGIVNADIELKGREMN